MTVIVGSTSRLARNPKIEEAPLQAEMMLFDPGTSQFYVLNPTMAFLWTHCDGIRTLKDIIEDAMEEFSGTDETSVRTDFADAASELQSLG
jgi:hypothetical protein